MAGSVLRQRRDGLRGPAAGAAAVVGIERDRRVAAAARRNLEAVALARSLASEPPPPNWWRRRPWAGWNQRRSPPLI
ncbi:hypothetical protein [Cyanobium sp. ATX-6F1]|uniref:hypothetical protein n=1 Tax=Cyanobium sp. ATX-6F1 TaxID=3137388 RepID=UPI0039BEC669